MKFLNEFINVDFDRNGNIQISMGDLLATLAGCITEINYMYNSMFPGY